MHWAPGASILDAPIFIIRLLAAMYLLAELVPESEPGPSIDFLLQSPASTLPESRKEIGRAASEDGKGEKARISKMRAR